MDPIRSNLVDYPLPCMKMPLVVYVPNSQKIINYDLILKPFTPLAWLSLGAALFIISILQIVPRETIPWWVDTWISHRIIVFSSWTLFILVNSYYAGTLTMFFATEAQLPFKDLANAMELYPSWRLLAHTSSEYSVKKYMARDEELESYIKKLRADSQQIFFDSYEQLFESLKQEGFFLYEAEVMNMEFYHKRYSGPILTSISTEAQDFTGLMLSKHSPLTKMISMGIILIF